MNESRQHITPLLPVGLQNVDLARLRFVLEFESSCTLQPSDFLGLNKLLRQSGRQFLHQEHDIETQQWGALFQPGVSEDPVARRKHQKPAPAYVVRMPISETTVVDVGDQLSLEVLFIGTGIPLIHVFLLSLNHLGRLGLVGGDGQFEVMDVFSATDKNSASLVWNRTESVGSLACPVVPITWLLDNEFRHPGARLRFVTPARLIVDGKPLKKPKFRQIFPFMLRRVTSMYHAHSGYEPDVDLSILLTCAREVSESESCLCWKDWRPIHRPELSIGGFVGEMTLEGTELEELYWVLASVSLFGLGKGATHGAGQVELLT